MSLVQMSVSDFVEELASASPAPGGGTIAAVTGAFAAGLGSMVCHLTIGNAKYPDAQAVLPKTQAELGQLKAELLRLADEDTQAFNRVMAAFKLPKDTEEEKTARKARIAEANAGATEVPLRTAQAAVEVGKAMEQVLTLGNENALSDCGVAIECARTAAQGAFMNVVINLPGVKDEALSRQFAQRLETLRKSSEHYYQSAMAVLKEKLL